VVKHIELANFNSLVSSSKKQKIFTFAYSRFLLIKGKCTRATEAKRKETAREI
jgi:hypothetical protein